MFAYSYTCVSKAKALLAQTMEWIYCFEKGKEIPQVGFFKHLVWLLIDGSTRPPFGTRVGKHL